MFIATVIVSVILAAIASLSAMGKLTRMEQIVATLNGVIGVPLERFPILAGLELAGAAGVIIGLWIAPIGIAAAAGLTLYFAGAIAAHALVGDYAGMSSPVVPFLIAVAALVLRIVTA